MPLRGIWIPIPARKPRFRRCSSVVDVYPLHRHALDPALPSAAFRQSLLATSIESIPFALQDGKELPWHAKREGLIQSGVAVRASLCHRTPCFGPREHGGGELLVFEEENAVRALASLGKMAQS